MDLFSLGWDMSCISSPIDVHNIARVQSVYGKDYIAISLGGKLCLTLSGKFEFSILNKAEFPVVGDFVTIDGKYKNQNDEDCAFITGVLPRKSCLSRKEAGSQYEDQILASNIDFALLTTSLNHDFSVNRLKRFVLLCRQNKIKPIIVLTKSDLVKSINEYILKIENEFSDISIHVTSTSDMSSFDILKAYFSVGKTGILLGSSGVGKSTLTNILLDHDIQKISDVREEDSKGRHTTTQRDLFSLPSGGWIIDCPGMREVGLSSDIVSVDEVFPQISEFSLMCKYSNCTHTNEKGCKIIEAIALGELTQRTYDSFVKMQKEADFQKMKQSKKHASNSKKKWKKIKVQYKNRNKVTY